MIWLWLLLVAVRIAFYFEINLLTGDYLAFLPDVTLFLALMGILLHFTVRYVKDSTPISKRDTVLLLLPAVILWATPLPVILGAHSRLLRKEGEFRRQIAEIESMDRGRLHLLPHVDPGPPRRIAFRCGLLGGYRAALIHDPSRTADLPDATGWFRGTLRSARPVHGDWFLGTFKNAPPKKRTRTPRQIYPKGVS